MHVKISKRAVDSISIRDKEYNVWDTIIPGFGIRVHPSGRRTYFLQYRASGRTRKFSIGAHGAWTPEQARKRAEDLRYEINSGKDPSSAKGAFASDISVSELCDEYLEHGCNEKKQSTILTDRGRIERHIKPLLGHLRVKAVTSKDAEAFMNAVIEGKSATTVKTGLRGVARVRGGKGTATRTMGLLGAVFTYAVRHELRPDNPVHGIKKPKGVNCERFLTHAEIRRLFEVLEGSEKLRLNPNAVPAIKLLLYTGCRKGEVLSLKWNEVDFENGYLHLADSKTGPRKVPLSAEARSILSLQPRILGNPYVFASDSGQGHFVGLQKPWQVIRKEAHIHDVRIHDLRHSFASILAEKGCSLVLIAKMLGHRDLRTTQIYAHLVDDVQQQAAQDAANAIGSIWTGPIDARPDAKADDMKRPDESPNGGSMA